MEFGVGGRYASTMTARLFYIDESGNKWAAFWAAKHCRLTAA
jgi:hypothetical protein